MLAVVRGERNLELLSLDDEASGRACARADEVDAAWRMPQVEFQRTRAGSP
jgi:hypothetical protein